VLEAGAKIAPEIMQFSPLLPLTVSLSNCCIIMEGGREKGKDRSLFLTYAHTGTATMTRYKNKMLGGLCGYFFPHSL